MKIQKDDFKNYIRSELIRRCRKNPRYSLRAFAKNLEMDSSTLSKILNGKRSLGRKAIHNIGVKLGLKPSEIRNLLSSFNSTNPGKQTEYDLITDDIFSFISDWSYYAILELIRVDGFKPSAHSISKALGVSVHEARHAIETLQRLNFIKIKSGKWYDLTSSRTTNISAEASSSARRLQQKQILTKAVTAIDNVPIEKRSNTSMTFAIDTSKLAEASELIKNFRRDMGQLLSRGERRDEVYNLAIALYPISKIKTQGDSL